MKRSIFFVQYTRPALYPPLDHSSSLLAAHGWDVVFLGADVDGSGNALELSGHPNIREVRFPLAKRAIGRRLRYPAFALSSIVRILRTRPDVVYCSDFLSYPVGLVVTLARRFTTVLHEHDPPAEIHTPPVRIVRGIRKLFARRATICILPQDQRADQFRRETGATRILVVYNCPLLDESRSEVAAHLRKDLTLWFHGSLNSSQLPFTVLQALVSLPSVRLAFAGYETAGQPHFLRDFHAEARRLGVASRVDYAGAIPDRKALLAAAARADVGLALFKTKFRAPMVGASNKPFDYLACGLPLLINATPEWQDFFGRVAKACDPTDPEDIARAISWFRDNPQARWKMAEDGHSMVRSVWNYEHQFAKILPIFEERVAST